ncbi:MAG: acyl-CoA dehydrogenase family protein [bacterium]
MLFLGWRLSQGWPSSALKDTTEAAKELAERRMRLCGGRGLLRSCPLERHLRDAMAGLVMPPANDRCLETAGKAALGLEARTLDFE